MSIFRIKLKKEIRIIYKNININKYLGVSSYENINGLGMFIMCNFLNF